MSLPVHDPNNIVILWVEADDEAQEGLVRAQVLRSLLAYLLLSDKLIIHPAYVWQSDTTRSLVLGRVGELLTPTNTSVFLGTDTASVAAYMTGRVERTSTLPHSPAGGISEYEEYARHGQATLTREQALLDNRFTAHGAVIASASSRDREFRRLIREDLVDEGWLSDRISGLLLCDPGVPERRTRELLQRLAEWTLDERSLVSGDTVLAQVVGFATYAPSTLQRVDHRTHVLHWACHITPSTRVPFVQRTSEPDRLDPLDPEVFWSAFRSLVGDTLCDRWLGCSEVDAVRIALDLRSTGTWGDFRDVYVSIVSAIDGLDLPVQERLVVRAVQTALPSRSRVILRRMVSLPIISTIAGAIRAMFGEPTGLVQAGGGLAALGNDILKNLEKYNTALREDVALHVRSALRTVVPDGSLLPVKIRAEDLVREVAKGA